jgi:hypothetical protein
MSSADRTARRYPVARTGAARRFLRERVYPAFRVPALLAYRMRLRFLFAISFFSPYDIIEFQRRPARSWSFLGWSADRWNDRLPPGEAIRGPSRLSGALDPEPTAQTDPKRSLVPTPK